MAEEASGSGGENAAAGELAGSLGNSGLGAGDLGDVGGIVGGLGVMGGLAALEAAMAAQSAGDFASYGGQVTEGVPGGISDASGLQSAGGIGSDIAAAPGAQGIGTGPAGGFDPGSFAGIGSGTSLEAALAALAAGQLGLGTSAVSAPAVDLASSYDFGAPALAKGDFGGGQVASTGGVNIADKGDALGPTAQDTGDSGQVALAKGDFQGATSGVPAEFASVQNPGLSQANLADIGAFAPVAGGSVTSGSGLAAAVNAALSGAFAPSQGVAPAAVADIGGPAYGAGGGYTGLAGAFSPSDFAGPAPGVDSVSGTTGPSAVAGPPGISIASAPTGGTPAADFSIASPQTATAPAATVAQAAATGGLPFADQTSPNIGLTPAGLPGTGVNSFDGGPAGNLLALDYAPLAPWLQLLRQISPNFRPETMA